MSRLIQMAGKRYGRLLVIERRHDATKHAKWLCRCDCGQTKIVGGGSLRSGDTSSCGCYRVDKKKTHGQSRTPEYCAWIGMLYRCEKRKHPSYRRYGARGITVCKRWHNFKTFLADMEERPGANYSLDRIDNNGNYEPINCKWSTRVEQMNNCRNNRVLTFRGESKTLARWAVSCDIKWFTLRGRLRDGWSMERALTQPVQVQRRRLNQ